MESASSISQSDLAFINRLESFCQQGDFQKFLQQLGDEHCLKFEDDADEQKLECYAIFQSYVEQLDQKLDEFLIQEKISAEDMFKICQRAYQKDAENLVCLNWILASVEYPKFVAMMLEFKVIIQGGKQWKESETDAAAYAEQQRRQQEYFRNLASQPQQAQVVDNGKPKVLITGINGYVGSQVCLAFLKNGGYQIRGTLRNKQDPKKFGETLKALGQGYLAQVELVDMELMDPASIDRAVAGCTYVIHVACPNPSKAPQDEKLVIRQATEGTVSVLKAAQAHKVKRVVITSSIASIFMRKEETHQSKYDERDWSEPEMCLNIHHKIKYQQEVEVWKWLNNQPDDGKRVEVVTLILGMVQGPTLVAHEFTAGIVVEQMMMGKAPGVAKMMFPLVDVRDAAIAHIKAIQAEGAKNQRIIIVGANIWFTEMANVLKEYFGPHGYNIKSGEIKLWMLKVASWIDGTAKSILPQWDKEQKLSNQKSIDILGMTYRPHRDTLIQMGENFIDMGLIKDKRKKK